MMSIFPTKILLATDGSREAELGATTAAALAKGTDSELHVVHVGPFMPMLFSSMEEEPARMAREARKTLDGAVGQLEAAGGDVEQAHLKAGGASEEIVALAEELGAGLIVMGNRGRGGVRRALMGSVSDSVVRHAHCPVLVVRAEPIVFPAKILVATDGSKEAELASSSAADLAERTGSELHVVYVGHMPPVFYESPGATTLDLDLQRRMQERAEEEARTRLDEQVQRVRGAGGEVAGVHARVGRPDAEIVGLAEELGAGLIVLGSRGLGPLRSALMGSVSDSTVRHARCPVLVVRE
ncbi:MAG: universal stress protein [Actinomycetota bacterium]|nr:universal stress protein [Actinomycetota bacterium]